MRGVIALTVAAVAAAVPVRAQQPPVDGFEVPGWSGGAYVDPRTGGFNYCAVTSAIGEVTLGFLLDKDQNFRVEIAAADWRLKPGSDYVTTLIIDSHEPLQTIATARSDRRIAIELGPDDDFIKALREGLFLRVLAEHVGLSFSLSGTSLALQRLRSCVSDHRGAASAARP